MRQEIEFTWEIFINMVDNMSSMYQITFTKLEKQLLRCYWNNLSRQDIIEVLNRNRLELGYYYKGECLFTMGLEPNLMKKLSISIDRPVNKSNFREIYQQMWARQN